MKVEYDLVIDFARPSKSNTILISEGDTNSRVCRFTLLANKTPMEMATVTAATVRGVKKNGDVIYADAVIATDDSGNKINEVDFTVPASITDEAGDVTMTITLLGSDSTQITSFEFYLKIRNALYNEDDLVSESDLTGFRDLLNRCLVAVQKMEAMTENTALPNPYPLNITVEDQTTQYTGREECEVVIENLTYIADDYDPEESIDETAAAAAALSAAAAALSEYNARLHETSALGASMTAADKADQATIARNAAANSAGEAEGYATQTREMISDLHLPTAAGNYKLTVTMTSGVPTYSWTEV